MNPPARSLLILATRALLIASIAGGCGAAYKAGEASMAAPEASPRASYASEEMGMPAPPPQPMAAPGGEAKIAESSAEEKPADKDGKADAGKGGPAKPAPTTWKRSQLAAHSVKVDVGDNESLPVRSMQAKVTLDGFMARVVLDMVVKNNGPRQYEGTLKLRLPTGSSPYYFAFGQDAVAIASDAAPAFFTPERVRTMGADPIEIRNDRQSLWMGVNEARMVPKEKAALAYTSTVRRQVDPALLEWSGPAIFNARVFPLVPNKNHRIVLGYDVPLTRIGEDLEYTFDLPDNVGSKAIDIAVAPPQGAAVESTPAVKPFEDKVRKFYRYDDPAGKTVTLRLKKPAPAFVVGSDAPTGSYFAADVTPQIPATAAAKGRDTALFMVDTSLSSNPDRFNVWIELLRSVLENNQDTIKRFNVMFFNIEQSFYKPSFVTNDATNRLDVLNFANTLALEGATDIGAALVRATRAPADGAANWDVFLLSDGSATWGESDAFTMVRRLEKTAVGSIYAYQTGMAGTDSDALSLLARETGGAVFSVMGSSEVKQASTAHRNRPLRLVSASVADGSDVIFAGRPRFIYPGQTLRVVGRGTPAANATLEMKLDAGGGEQTVKVPLGQPITSPLAVRAYGQVATAHIEELAPVTEAMSKAYSIHFRVPGKTSSLLMLESEADYQRFGIVPEDFAKTIKSAQASRIVEDSLDLAAKAIGNPKAAFLRWFDTLPTMASVSFFPHPAFRPALERMPESSFRVDAAPLEVKQRTKVSLPKNIVDLLATHKLDYDVISGEAERRRSAAGPADALKALSSLVEENPGDAVLARDVGISAMSFGLSADAFHLFRRVANSRPYEPQTYRAMGQALTRMGQADLAIAYFEVALAGRWDGRFGDFRKIVAVEYFDLLQQITSGKMKTSVPDFAKQRLPEVAREVQIDSADIVVMITWNTDGTDVDLHVTEPGGETCFYGNRNTRMGGKLTQDVTQGYGPEMYVLKNAQSGQYLVQAKYFASDRNRASTRTKVSVVVIEDYGTQAQRMSERVVTLAYDKDMHDLFKIGRKATNGAKKPVLQMAE